MEGDSVQNALLGQRKIVGIDVEDLLIIDTKDTIFVMKSGSSSKIKELFNKVKEENPELLK